MEVNVNNNMQMPEAPQTDMPTATPEAQETQSPQPQAQAQQPQTGVQYASFGARFVALLIDAILLGILNSVLMFVAKSLGDSVTSTMSLLTTLIGWLYFVYLDVTQGATIGKKAMKLRVQKLDTGENLNYVEAFLREVVGKILSSIVLFLGYFWMLWDEKKQTWHDKIAGSVVIKVS